MTDKTILLMYTIGMHSNFVAFIIYAMLFVTTKHTEDGIVALLFACVCYYCADKVSKAHDVS